MAGSRKNPEEPQYVALIGDVVLSRRLAARQRAALQQRLRGCLDAFNAQHADGIAARLLTTLGDEFQGLFRPSPAGCRAAVALMRGLTLELAPTRMRFALGAGPLTTALLPEALGMDGPCFHRAREGLVRLKAEDLSCILKHRGTPLETLWTLLATDVIRQAQRWTEPQRRTIALLYAHGGSDAGPTQKDAARRLRISESAVSQRLHAANWRFHRTAMATLETTLATLVDPKASPV